MEFKRKKIRGVNKTVCRHWYSEEGYRIVWRKEVFKISVPPRFQACVRTIVPGDFEGGSALMWDFVNHKRPLFKTMKAASEECERHKRMWSKATQCTGIRAIRELFGKQPSCVPKWAFNKLDRRVVAILMDTSPRVKYEDEEEIGPTPEPEPELPAEPTKRRRRRGTKPVKEPREPGESGEPGKRKQRSDKGKKRGPRIPKLVGAEFIATVEAGGIRKQETRGRKP